jgi:LPPG:FO 2-phospho-L-lactate transferase
VIANTGDDIDIYGAAVSPDPDLVTFWLADVIDERGWGLHEDTFAVMDAMRELGADVWFSLGDRDLAWCAERARMLAEGMTPTGALGVLAKRIGVQAEVLPMCDEPFRTRVNGMGLQEFLIREGGRGPIDELALGGSVRPERDAPQPPPDAQPPPSGVPRPSPDAPQPSPEVLAALAGARAVIVGPSNPVISIWPILAVIGEHLRGTKAPVVAVSPVVGGKILKGPTDVFLDHFGIPATAAGVAEFYESRFPGLLDGMVADEPVPGSLAVLDTDTLMADAAGRARVAAETLAFAESVQR